ncbi:MAG TPA: hypothetical protein PLX56_12720, partial [bacterium]|nr:hypothetical protein [bacterium]
MNFEKVKNIWRASAELIDTNSKERLLIASGDGESMFAAADNSSKELEKIFKGSVEKPFAEKFFKDRKEALTFVATDELLINDFSVGQIMPALTAYYQKSGMGSIVLSNRSDKVLENVNIQYLVKENVAGSEKISALKPKETRTVAVKLNVVPDIRSFGQLQAVVTYESASVFKRSDAYAPLIVHDKNTVDWSNPKSVASFIDPNSKSVRESSSSALKSSKLPDNFLTDKLAKAALIYSALWHKPLSYIADPVTPGSNVSLDTVQLPYETILRKAGDCDDLTVLLASLFESVGLSTAVITTPGHVLLAVETGLLKGGEVVLGLSSSLFITVDGALYLPVEATVPGTSFKEAWKKGAESISKEKSGVTAFRVREAWKKYPAGFSTEKEKGTIPLNKVDISEIS